MGRGPDKLDEERVCIDALLQHLRETQSRSPIDAQPEKDDPPDFWLSFGAQRFAVEVTSIVTDEDYAARCQSLLGAIKEQFTSDAPVAGTYVVRISRCPDIPKRGSNEWNGLVVQAAAHIRAMAASSSDSEVVLSKDGRNELAIARLSDAGSTIGLFRIPANKRAREVESDLTRLLQVAIDKKRSKIQSKGVMSLCPDVILILYDAYGYGNLDTARQALLKVTGHGWLHSIYWTASFSDRDNLFDPASPGRGGAFLYSKSQSWLGSSVLSCRLLHA